MRIISGKFKGKSILFSKSETTRPLKDSVKENFFNIIQHSKLINFKIDNSNILDMYSGVGSFGLEALSRGAKKVTFIEKDENTLKILETNIINLSLSSKVELIKSDIHYSLQNKKLEKYDLFFLDPPFADTNFHQLIQLIKIRKFNKKDSIIIIHREKKSVENFNNVLTIFLTKNYGRSKILFGKFSS